MKKIKNKYILMALSVIFFFVYLFLSIDYSHLSDSPVFAVDEGGEPIQLIFNQPDESINYLFTRSIVFDHKFFIPEPLSLVANNQVHPRSTTVVHGSLAPIGFPGIILFLASLTKMLAVFFGKASFNFWVVAIVPFIGAIAPLFFYGLIKNMFHRKIALWSAIFLFFNPAWWYYSSRSLQHTIVFSTFLIIALYCGSVFLKHDKKNVGYSFLFGLFYALAIFIRPIEAYWLGPLLFFFLFKFRQSLNKKTLLALFTGAILIAILFFVNQILFYGSIFSTGYAVPQADGTAGEIASKFSLAGLYPFGFSLVAIIKNIFFYGVLVFPFWGLLYFVAFVFLLWKIHRTKTKHVIEKRIFFVFKLFAWIALALLLYYGAWNFADNVAGKFSIGSSQVRYFMPLYLFGSFFIGTFFSYLLKNVKSAFVAAILFIGLLYCSIHSVFFAFEGLRDIKHVVHNYYEVRQRIADVTEDNAIIITKYSDKYIYPERKVITGWEEDYYAQGIFALLKEGYPVYIFAHFDYTDSEKETVMPFMEKGYILHNAIYTFENLELKSLSLPKLPDLKELLNSGSIINIY